MPSTIRDVHGRLDRIEDALGRNAINLRALDPSVDAASVFHVGDEYYGAVGANSGSIPTIDETSRIQAAIDDAATVEGTIQLGLRAYKAVGPLTPKNGVTIQGVTGFWGQGTYGSRIYGGVTPGPWNNIFEFPPLGVNSFTIRDLIISYGQRAISTPAGFTGTLTDILLERVYIAGSIDALIYLEGAVEEWYMDKCYLGGGTYGFYKAFGGGANLFDKCTFNDVTTNGQSKNGWRIEATTAGTNTWSNPIMQTSGEHGMYVDGGTFACLVENPNTESNGTSGKNHRTTLTDSPLAAAATSGTLSSLTAGPTFAKTLSGSIASSGAVDTITLTTAPGATWFNSGSVLIDSEAFHFTGVSGSTLTGCTRAVQGTSMAAHSGSPTVSLIWSDGTHPNAGDGITNVITIRGAGLNGVYHIATITTINVPTKVVSWTGGTVTQVTTPGVTNAVFSDFCFRNTHGASGDWQFIGGAIGGEASTRGKILNGLDATSLAHCVVLGTKGSGGFAGLYDPGRSMKYFGSAGRITWDRGTQAGAGGGYFVGSPEVFTKAGIPADGDFAATPASGTLALDTVNNRLYVRVGSTWKSVLVA